MVSGRSRRGPSGLEAICGAGGTCPEGANARSLSPEGQPGPGVVQPLQRAQVVGQRVLGIAGQDGKDHGGQRRLHDARSLEPRPQQEQQLEQRGSGGGGHGGRSGGGGGCPRGSGPAEGTGRCGRGGAWGEGGAEAAGQGGEQAYPPRLGSPSLPLHADSQVSSPRPGAAEGQGLDTRPTREPGAAPSRPGAGGGGEGGRGEGPGGRHPSCPGA